MWFILIILLCIYVLITMDFDSSVKTYNREYSKLYDTIWNDEDRYKAEVKYILLNVGDKQLDSILDIGCGTGNHIKFWKETCPSSIITGMDISFSQLAKLREKHPNVNIVHGNFLDGRVWLSNTFDMIVCMYDAGQYTSKVKTLLKNVYTWLKPGGIFVFHGIDPDRLCDGCHQTASNTSLPMRVDHKGHCNVLYPNLIYSSWWNKSIFSNWVRYNETFYTIRGNEWTSDWDVSNKVGKNVPIGAVKNDNLMTNGHNLYLLPPSRIMKMGRDVGFVKVTKDPVLGITGIWDQGSEEYFIFFKK
jgi:ubiquinone/menaquinone biosynthesis C-methylase UbiE